MNGPAPDSVSITNVALQATATSGFAGSTTVNVPGTITATALPTTSTFFGIKATVVVNGQAVGEVPVGSNGFTYQRAWGTGIVSLVNFKASGRDTRPGQPNNGFFTDQVISAPSNAVQIRFGVDNSSSIKVTKRGKKLTFKLKARYINNVNAAVGLRRATIQVKKGGTWKTLKHVKLKSNGTATYKRTDGKKRNYRMLIKTTDQVQGGNTTGTRKL